MPGLVIKYFTQLEVPLCKFGHLEQQVAGGGEAEFPPKQRDGQTVGRIEGCSHQRQSGAEIGFETPSHSLSKGTVPATPIPPGAG